MKLYSDPEEAIKATTTQIQRMNHLIHTEKWQGFDISKKPEAEMHEILEWDFKFPMVAEDLGYYRKQIQPNIPWADDHFEERVSGEPVNPGETWKNWPWANKADESRIFDGKFSHTYMERYWPKVMNGVGVEGHRFLYGDLDDVVALLTNEPLTRQAYLPIFFPEDTGAVHGNRIPCTLGYWWIRRGNHLHVHYPIRSCDFYRHFRDDIYLTVRLTIWLLKELREKSPEKWNNVKLGTYSMWIGSLHLFRNDFIKLFGATK
jgi:thymidylate synthase